MQTTNNIHDKANRGADDAGRYFRAMAEFVGFNRIQVEAVRESRFIIEKHLPAIVAAFYDHLLIYPPTRKVFLLPDGSINHEYVKMRMHHLTNFWRRTASGPYDDEYARYIDYVGRAHTRRGADPNIDIAERYVIGQVGFVQHAISEALSKELHEIDPEWEVRALKAWNLLMMVLLEMLSRVYHEDEEFELPGQAAPFDSKLVHEMALDIYEQGLGIHRIQEIRQRFVVAKEEDIPPGNRKLITIQGIPIGVFHHRSGWYAVRNRCLHAGGPVAEGRMRGDTLICPWHGFQYNLLTGEMLSDPSARLEMFPIELIEGQIFVTVPIQAVPEGTDQDQPASTLASDNPEAAKDNIMLPNQFKVTELPTGKSIVVEVGGESVAVFNLDGTYYAIDDFCPHAGGPLSEGKLDGLMVICPWHGSCFDLTSGERTCGPAQEGVRTYQVTIDGEIGQVN